MDKKALKNYLRNLVLSKRADCGLTQEGHGRKTEDCLKELFGYRARQKYVQSDDLLPLCGGIRRRSKRSCARRQGFSVKPEKILNVR